MEVASQVIVAVTAFPKTTDIPDNHNLEMFLTQFHSWLMWPLPIFIGGGWKEVPGVLRRWGRRMPEGLISMQEIASYKDAPRGPTLKVERFGKFIWIKWNGGDERHWVHLQILEEEERAERRRRRRKGGEGSRREEKPELKLTSADRMWSEESENENVVWEWEWECDLRTRVSMWSESESESERTRARIKLCEVSADLRWQQAEQWPVERGLRRRNRWPSPVTML